MRQFTHWGIAIILLSLFILGCGNSGSDPIAGNTDNNFTQTYSKTDVNYTPRVLWGLWHCFMEPGSDRIEIVPLRTANFTANMNNLLSLTEDNFQISDLDVTNLQTEGRLDCTVTIKHPFLGHDQFHGFDVRGVFLHNGASTLTYDGLTYSGGPDAGGNEATLLNADGWTRWFNQPEFNGDGIPLFEYCPGELSNLPNPSAMLNPYKIFADYLDMDDDYHEWVTAPGNADDRGIFRAGMINSRRYKLEFPIIDGSPVVDFQYAVIAAWEPGDPTLSGQPDIYDPDDFPSSANCEEAFFLDVSTVASDLYYENETNSGGNFRADIEVFDWQGGSVGGPGVPNEIERIIIEGDFVPTGSYEFSQVGLAAVAIPGTENSSVFQVEIANCTPQSSSEADLWVIVEAAGLNGDSYGQGFPTEYPDPARRAAFMQSSVSVLSGVISTIILAIPNGGEVWMVGSHHDITWTTTYNSGQIKLEYSKDEFVSDINEIVAATDDDGVYNWEIPDDTSDTVRVRATLVNAPSIHDDSDADFTILPVMCWGFDEFLGFPTCNTPYGDPTFDMDVLSPALCEEYNGDLAMMLVANNYLGTNPKNYIVVRFRSTNDGDTYSCIGMPEYGPDFFYSDQCKIFPSQTYVAYSTYSYGSCGIAPIIPGACKRGFQAGYPAYNTEVLVDIHGWVYCIRDLTSSTVMRRSPSKLFSGDQNWYSFPDYTITSGNILSHVRSIDLGDGEDVFLAVFSTDEKIIHLCRNTDYDPITAWDDTTVVFNSGSDYYEVRDPSLHVEPGNICHIAYTRRVTAGGNYQLVYTRDNETFDDPVEVVIREQANPFNDAVLSLGHPFGLDVISVAYESGNEVWLFTSLDGGENFDGPELVSTPGSMNIDPDMIIDADEGHLHVVWAYMDGDNYDVGRRNAALIEE